MTGLETFGDDDHTFNLLVAHVLGKTCEAHINKRWVTFRLLTTTATTSTSTIATHHHYHFWQAPLRVRSAERRHRSEWTVLSQVNCVVHIEVAGFQILLNGFHLFNTRMSQWSPPVSYCSY